MTEPRALGSAPRWFALRVALCLLAGSIASACAPRVAPRASAPAWLTGSADEVYAALRRREAAMQTLRARFSAVFLTQGSETTSRRASGVLLVKKPDRFRLRLLSPFGFTVFDYLSYGEHARIELPLEGKQLVDSEADQHTPFPPRLLREQFLHEATAFVGHCTEDADPEMVYLACREADGPLVRRISIERSTGRVRREVTLDDVRQRLQFAVDYSEYRPVSGFDLPFAISLGSESQRLNVTVAVYEVNPMLSDDLFAPAGAVTAAP